MEEASASDSPRIPERIALAPTRIASSQSEVSGRVTMKAPSSRTATPIASDAGAGALSIRRSARRRRGLRTAGTRSSVIRAILVGPGRGTERRLAGMDSAAPKRVAQEAEQNTPFRALARAGYAANGLVHILIGAIALVVAFGGDGVTDQSGALMAIAGVPLGFILLWVVAITLWALGVWQVLEGILMRASSDDAAGSPASGAGAWGPGGRRPSSSPWV